MVLLSIKLQEKQFSHPLLAFGNHWTVLYKQDSLFAIVANSSEYKLLSGVANGAQITVDLELYDNADSGAVGDGLKLVIENQDDFPLIDLNGFNIEPGKAANIQVQPKLHTISEAALDKFNYIDRKCVGKEELKIRYFERYGLANCLVSAAITELNENCPDGNSGQRSTNFKTSWAVLVPNS